MAQENSWAQIRPIVESALELPQEDRHEYLERTCQGDSELRQAVETYLEVDVDQVAMLNEPVFPFGEKEAEEEALAGTEVGSYRLVRELGRGGLGVVYLAERSDDEYERKVAIKIIKRGMDTDEIVQRFRTERQILANLDHPNIAKLFEGGTTEDGRPYFVMEYIEGEPLTQYCSKLSLPQKLHLFRKICAAVHFAHQNLVVHRDLKPSNILVTVQGEPKLLDFGIAKILSSQSQEISVTVGVKRLTPGYASPEQIKSEPITTVSDVYTLGVILCEMLSGHRPYGLKSRSHEEMLRVVSETEPLRPSILVNQAGEVTSTSESGSRLEGTGKLRRRLSGDLDTIVLMALRKEPQRRYSSAQQLAADIDRHLHGLPVLARKDTFTYRLGKFMRRNRLGVAVAASLVFMFLAFGATLMAQQRQTIQERDRAERVSRFLEDIFKLADPDVTSGETVSAREILDNAVAKLRTTTGVEPEVQTILMKTIGRVYRHLGLHDRSRTLLEEALHMRRQLVEEDDAEVASILNDLGVVYRIENSLEKAERTLRESLSIFRKTLNKDNTEVASTLHNISIVYSEQGDYEAGENAARESLFLLRHLGDPDITHNMQNLAWILRLRDKYDEAESLLREALEIYEVTHGAEIHTSLAATHNSLGLLLKLKGNYHEAEFHFQKALELYYGLYGKEHRLYLYALNNLAALALSRGNLEDAEQLFGEYLMLSRKIFGEIHLSVATALNNLSFVFRARGQYEEAESLLRDSLEMRRELLGTEHPLIATTLSSLAGLLQGTGHIDQAEAMYREALTIDRSTLQPGHRNIGRELYRLASVAEMRGDFLECEQLVRDALEILPELADDELKRRALAENVLGGCLAGQERYAEAEPLLLNSYEVIRQIDGALNASNVQRALDRLILLYEGWGNLEEAGRYRQLAEDRQ